MRVWDLASGQLLRTLRPPIGDGYEGKIYAVAMTPDGEIIAAGGWTSASDASENIYLFDRRSGRLVRRIGGLHNVVNHLAFSPDGTRLVATLGGANGIRVFRTQDGFEIGKDASYGNNSYGAAFFRDGRLVTTSHDGKVRLYDRELHLLASLAALGGKQPFGVAFSPDGGRIAVGYDDSTRVDVLDETDLHLFYSANSQGTDGNLGSVAWSADGKVLYGAGRFVKEGPNPIRRWSEEGRGAFRDLEGPKTRSWL